MIEVEIKLGSEWSAVKTEMFFKLLKDKNPNMIIMKGNEGTVVTEKGDTVFRTTTDGEDPVTWLRKTTNLNVCDCNALH